MLRNPIEMAEEEVATDAGKRFIKRVGAKNGARGNVIVVAERGPALNHDVRFEPASGTDIYVLLDNAEVANIAPGSYRGIGVYTRGRSHSCRGVD